MRSEGDEKLFLQALIQVAAACVHLTRGNAAPAARLLGLAEAKLARLENRELGGLGGDFLREQIRQAAERIERGETPADVARTFRI
jgi:predicted metal-dependent hydrolase